MKGRIIATLTIILILIVSFWEARAQHILPTPLSLEYSEGHFTFGKKLFVFCDKNDEKVAGYVKSRLEQYVDVIFTNRKNATLVLSTQEVNLNTGDEGYVLNIFDNQINVSANSSAGLFYGIQSLLQMLPVEIQAGKPFKLDSFKLREVKLKDKPKYAWRSFMLDSGRQYHKLDFIKKYLDNMTMLKMNVFHWHLTEGLGWRIEIKKYPKLTSIGSKVGVKKEQQGFYTQEEIKEIVAYAQERFIKVVPEIDVPGHSEAALTAYPELTCFRKAPDWDGNKLTSYLYCGGNEETYNFLKNVLDEVCDIFPSDYIHLGGDEAKKEQWDMCPQCQKKIQDEALKNSHELQLYFSNRLALYLKEKGRKVIFWGDVVHHEDAKLPDNVVICWWNYWKKDLGLNNAIKRGLPVICNTNRYTYLNFPVTPWERYKVNRTFDLRKVYDENPSDIQNPDALILGMSCSLWTDNNVKQDMIDQRVFPRIYALAEQMWNSGQKLEFEDFYNRVKSKYCLLNELNITYGPALKEEVPEDYKWD